ncbi:hypothetical protein [Methanobrevibacter sp.]|uniref:hypothetical protein n=1 Tax=Methanobrevibacter sp. TaxID=66852 RepID=UPI0025D6CE28|nr:hypothetical protein [Methanobrevibacter sp.]MBR4447669.1 hypothetical protein [Methanobrevibacter sp.]
MLINKTRINKLESQFKNLDIKEGDNLVVSVLDIGRFDNLNKIGFTEKLELNEQVLPAINSGLGKSSSVSRHNSEGSYIKRPDWGKETKYYEREFTRHELRGRYRTEEVTDICTFSRETICREYIEPPSIELRIVEKDGNKIIIATQEFRYKKDDEILKHTINLFLELFKECEVLKGDLSELTVLSDLKNIKRLNWEILPEGEMPWEKLKEHMEPVLNQTKKTKKPADERRLKYITSFKPISGFIGKSGFNGYVGFEFKDFTILESLLYGNAIYVFNKNCIELTKLTKKEILDDNLHIKRIIHKDGWEKEVRDLFEN